VQKFVQPGGCSLQTSLGTHPNHEPLGHLWRHHGIEELGNHSARYELKCHFHCEKDTTNITRDRFGFPEDEEQRKVCVDCNGMKNAKFGDFHNLERRVRENKN
jgi:hypothetical protein